MIVLAIDTSGSGCHAALYDDEKDAVAGMAGAEIGRGHAERLMEYIDAALDAAALDGVATARGLSLALGVPAVGVTTFSAIAAGRQDGRPLLIAMDARGGEVYCQSFAADGSAQGAPALLSVDEARHLAADHPGDLAGSAAAMLREGAPPESDAVSIAAVARLGARLAPGESGPKPLYLRGPDAKPQAGFAIRRA